MLALLDVAEQALGCALAMHDLLLRVLVGVRHLPDGELAMAAQQEATRKALAGRLRGRRGLQVALQVGAHLLLGLRQQRALLRLPGEGLAVPGRAGHALLVLCLPKPLAIELHHQGTGILLFHVLLRGPGQHVPALEDRAHPAGSRTRAGDLLEEQALRTLVVVQRPDEGARREALLLLGRRNVLAHAHDDAALGRTTDNLPQAARGHHLCARGGGTSGLNGAGVQGGPGG
mmetsp:Transcript_74774/g.206132  ORF Transcript_74774/g.206132 Transcript_74774/m.206132 type:complete len:231 (+) Transcript_74774:2366-3058(+)